MPREPSSQVSILQRLLHLGSTMPDRMGFTTDEIRAWPVFRRRKTLKNSIVKGLTRFMQLDIIHSPGFSPSGKRLYRIKNHDLAMAYIVRDPRRPWLPLTPTPPSCGFLECDEHRDHFDIKLTTEWFERVKSSPDILVKNNQYTLRRKTYTVSVNGKSYAGQIFVRIGWQAEVKSDLGEGFHDYLVGLESEGALRGDLCIPIGIKGNRLTIGGRPTQISASHFQSQLDIRRAKNDSNVVDGILGIVNQADFNTRVLDFCDDILSMLKKQGDVQETAVVLLRKLIELRSPNMEPAYQSSAEDEEGFAYR